MNRIDVENLFDGHYGDVFKAAYRITGNSADAEDAAQVVFLRLLGGGCALDASLEPGPYLRRAAVNAALDIRRQKREGRHLPLDDSPLPAVQDRHSLPDQIHDANELGAWLRETLLELPSQAAEIFALRFFEEMRNHEIANLLGTSEGTVAVTVHRIRSRLRERLTRFLEGRK